MLTALHWGAHLKQCFGWRTEGLCLDHVCRKYPQQFYMVGVLWRCPAVRSSTYHSHFALLLLEGCLQHPVLFVQISVLLAQCCQLLLWWVQTAQRSQDVLWKHIVYSSRKSIHCPGKSLQSLYCNLKLHTQPRQVQVRVRISFSQSWAGLCGHLMGPHRLLLHCGHARTKHNRKMVSDYNCHLICNL